MTSYLGQRDTCGHLSARLIILMTLFNRKVSSSLSESNNSVYVVSNVSLEQMPINHQDSQSKEQGSMLAAICKLALDDFGLPVTSIL